MEQAGRSFAAMLDRNAAFVGAADLDFALLQDLTRFFGSGASIVGKPGSYEEAKVNDFRD
jgi:hypothetical protein